MHRIAVQYTAWHTALHYYTLCGGVLYHVFLPGSQANIGRIEALHGEALGAISSEQGKKAASALEAETKRTNALAQQVRRVRIRGRGEGLEVGLG